MHDWRDALMDLHPDLFTTTVFGHVVRPGRPYIDDGWREIIERLIRRIRGATVWMPGGAAITIVRIEQKMGGLRLDFRASGLTAAIIEEVEKAVELVPRHSDYDSLGGFG
jgi:hypothetical protein